MTHEEWRPCPAFHGVYEVSCLGRVRRIAPAKGTRPGRVLKPGLNATGYPVVDLRAVGERRERRRIHRLVAIAFMGDRSAEGMEVNHKDGDKLNAAASNLEWVTHAQNVAHAVEARLIPPHPSRTPDADRELMRQLRSRGVPVDAVAEIVGCHRQTVVRLAGVPRKRPVAAESRP